MTQDQDAMDSIEQTPAIVETAPASKKNNRSSGTVKSALAKLGIAGKQATFLEEHLKGHEKTLKAGGQRSYRLLQEALRALIEHDAVDLALAIKKELENVE